MGLIGTRLSLNTQTVTVIVFDGLLTIQNKSMTTWEDRNGRFGEQESVRWIESRWKFIVDS